MPTVQETARRILALIEAAESLGSRTLITRGTPSADEKAMCAVLATRCPGLIMTTNGRHGVDIISPGGVSVGFHDVAPSCFVPRDPFDLQAAYDAYVALVRIAYGADADLTRAGERQGVAA